MTGKTVEYSQVIMSIEMLPQHANAVGNVHGGEIMKLIDSAGGVVAHRHARRIVCWWIKFPMKPFKKFVRR